MRAMRLNVQSRPARGGSTGFTLLEVVVAGGILLLTIAAVTFCVVNVSRAGARLESSMDADRAVRQVAQRLRLLSYCAGAYPKAANGPETDAGDLIATVFPHADPAQNIPEARYIAVAVGEEEPDGSFVTLLSEEGMQVKCVARFLAGPNGPELGTEALGGWDTVAATAPPAPTLSLTLSVAGSGRIVRFSRTALASAPIDGQPTPGVGK
jgi:type II secretory pathway pseudopilin PulG